MNKIKVNSSLEGFKKAKDLLYQNCDTKTVLFVSGGSTPKVLYQDLAKERMLKISVAALVDERYGEVMHDDSNEKMIDETGLFKYLEIQNISVFNILSGKSIGTITKEYEEVVLELLKSKNKIAILGIGADGHTAGIAPNRADFTNPIFGDRSSLVANFNDATGNFKQRITLTFKALEQMDKLILLAFGQEKKWALEQMFKNGSLEEIPARFLNQKGISEKVILITDQVL